MNTKTAEKAVNIRVLPSTRDRLKLKAARKKMSIMKYVEELSKILAH